MAKPPAKHSCEFFWPPHPRKILKRRKEKRTAAFYRKALRFFACGCLCGGAIRSPKSFEKESIKGARPHGMQEIQLLRGSLCDPCAPCPLFPFLHPEDAPQKRREKAGGSHQNDLHISTPFFQYVAFASPGILPSAPWPRPEYRSKSAAAKVRKARLRQRRPTPDRRAFGKRILASPSPPF